MSSRFCSFLITQNHKMRIVSMMKTESEEDCRWRSGEKDGEEDEVNDEEEDEEWEVPQCDFNPISLQQ